MSSFRDSVSIGNIGIGISSMGFSNRVASLAVVAAKVAAIAAIVVVVEVVGGGGGGRRRNSRISSPVLERSTQLPCRQCRPQP